MLNNVNWPLIHDAEKYEKERYKGLDQKIINEREKNTVKKILQGVCFANVLDIPCGTGRFIETFKKLGVNEIFAGDRSCASALLVKKRYPEVHVFVGSAENLPIKSGVVDLIFCVRFFHHQSVYEKREEIFKEFTRIAKKYLLFSFYRDLFFHKLSRVIRGLDRLKAFVRVEEFSKFTSLPLKKVLKPILFFHSQTFVLLGKETKYN